MEKDDKVRLCPNCITHTYRHRGHRAILITAGFLMKKVEGGCIKLRGVYDEFDKTIKEIHEIRRHTSS